MVSSLYGQQSTSLHCTHLLPRGPTVEGPVLHLMSHEGFDHTIHISSLPRISTTWFHLLAHDSKHSLKQRIKMLQEMRTTVEAYLELRLLDIIPTLTVQSSRLGSWR